MPIVREAAPVRVELKLFATYRRYLPPHSTGNACHVTVPAGTPVIDLLTELGVPSQRGVSVVLINGHDASPDRVVEEGDVVAVFPALAGG